MKIVKSLTAQETLDLISKSWATTEDIQKLCRCGNERARTIRDEIKAELLKQGYITPNFLIPMDKLVEYSRININYLKKVAK